MNNEEKKLTEYIHNIIEDNIFLRKENDRLWKQKLEYLDRINKAIEYMKHNATSNYFDEEKNMFRREIDLLEILKGSEE